MYSNTSTAIPTCVDEMTNRLLPAKTTIEARQADLLTLNKGR